MAGAINSNAMNILEMNILETICAVLFVAVVVYLFWQSVLIRQALLEKRRDERERPISIFDDRKSE